MKCPECDGTGKVVHPMMSMNGDEYTGEWEQHECDMCGGAGVIQGKAPFLVSCCPACDGKGFIVQTNEEWFCELSTEEKAVFMTLFSLRRANVHDKTFYETAADSANKAMELTVGTKRLNAYKELLAWLKGEHKA